MPLYFAYGSNMDVAQMARRCPASRPLGTARLIRHRFHLMREGWATVAPSPRGEVWGLLWELALADVPALDRYEEVRSGLYRKILQPVVTKSGPRRALLYVGRPGEGGAPPPGYVEGILAAGRAIGLPEAYLATIERFSPDRPRAATKAGL